MGAGQGLRRAAVTAATVACLAAAGCGSGPGRSAHGSSDRATGAVSSGRATGGVSFAGPDGAPATLSSAGSTPASSSRFRLSFAGLADQSLAGFRGPGGRVFSLQFDYDGTGLAVRSGRMVRAHDTAQGAPILIVPNARVPDSVDATVVFLPGRPATENVVVGTCATAFRQSSVQLALWPDHWRLIYTQYSAAQGRTVSTTLATGTLPHVVPTDGRTPVSLSLTRTGVDTVQVRLPGIDRSVSAPAVSRYWGAQFGIQIRHPAGTGGDAAVLAIGDHLT